MKNLTVFLGLFFAARSTLAQPGSTVQTQCRDLTSTGNVLGPDETLVNGMACHVVKANQASSPSAPAKPAAATVPSVDKASPAHDS
jgi:hypothetical protein